MEIGGAKVLITGANRGLGLSLVEAALTAGAARIYAAARRPETLARVIALDPRRVLPLTLDITDPGQIEAAVDLAGDASLLVNNAGILDFAGPLAIDHEIVSRNMATNFHGTSAMMRAFGEVMAAREGGTIVNILTFLCYVSAPVFSAYNASKAASWSMAMSLRAVYAPRGVAIVNVFPTTIDTEMVTVLDKSKAAPADIANDILRGLAAGEDDIYPLGAAQVYAAWRANPKAVEAQFAKII